MTHKKIIELLRSGNFTIIYWDNQTPSLYRGTNYDVNDFPDNAQEIELPYLETGYTPSIVELMAEALNGKSDSI